MTETAKRQRVDEYDPLLNNRVEKLPLWYHRANSRLQALISKAATVKHSELEARLGSLDLNNVFVPGVSHEYFTKKVKSCDLGLCWSSRDRGVKSVDFSIKNNKVIRQCPDKVASCVTKMELDYVIVPTNPAPFQLCAKVSLKTESPARIEMGPIVRTRVKTRASFVYKERFRYDFTQVFEARYIDSALKEEPKYEIEIEILKYDEPVETTAKSLALKIDDFLR